MTKKLLASLALVSLALTSCGSTGGTSTNATSSGGTSDGGSYDSVTVAGDKEIQFWHCIGHDKMRNLEVIIDKFNEDHASTDGYYVTAKQVAGSYDALHDNVKTRLNAGYVPSITMGYPDSFAEYMGSTGVSNSMILNLDNFIANDSDFSADDFVTEYYEEGTNYQYEGTWSLPLYKSTEVMYYNKTMYEASTFYKNHKDETYGNYGAKLSDPSTWDWDTLIYVATQIQEENKSTSDFHALGYDSDSNLFISQMAQRGIDYTTAEVSGTTSDEQKASHFLFYDPQTNTADSKLVSFATEIYNLVSNGVLVTQGSYGSYASDLFLKKKVMFTIGSTGGSAYNEPDGAFQCGLTKVPAYQNNEKYIMQGPSLCFFNTNDTAKEQAAWEFYSEYVADATLNANLALENSYDPVKTASYETEGYKEWCSMGVTSDGSDDVTAALAYRIPNLTPSLKDSYMTSPVFIGSSTARDEIGSIITYAVSNNGDINAAILRAYTNCLLAA